MNVRRSIIHNGHMARSIANRLYSSQAPVSLNTEGPWVSTELISPNHAQKLDATIADWFAGGKGPQRRIGDALPLGYHLIYFNPSTEEHKLSPDGYESYQSPSDPSYVNRMWLGGSVEFKPINQIKFGQLAAAVESIESISRKPDKTGKDRILVGLDRKMAGLEQASLNEDSSSVDIKESLGDNWTIRERRNLLYFTEEGGLDRSNVFNRIVKPPSGATNELTVKSTITTLFRYSALTFNSHRVHYDRIYAREQEKLPDILVHGPFTLTILLSWLSNHVLPPNEFIKRFEYKNLVPLFVDQEFKLCCKPNEKGSNSDSQSYTVWIENRLGSCSVLGKVELH